MATEVSAALAGASRVLLAGRSSDAPDHVRVQALVVQAVELAAQISRTIAAHQDATAAQRRAAEATRMRRDRDRRSTRRRVRAAVTKTGAEVMEPAREQRAAGGELGQDTSSRSGPDPRMELPEPDQ